MTPEAVRTALKSVFDPEYPGVSIVDLGLLESVDVTDNNVRVGLIPTFSGCPALPMIADDVRTGIERNFPDSRCVVDWLNAPIWDTSRVSASAKTALAQDFTVTLRRKDGSLRCPACGADTVVDQSMAGPTRCRSVAWCNSCRNPVEVLR